jgi:small-conductance mechanosensitive channel
VEETSAHHRDYDSMPSMTLLLWPGVALVVTTLAALVLRGITLTVLGRWVTSRPGRTSFVEPLRLPSLLWCVVLGFYAAIQAASLPPAMGGELNRLVAAAIIVSVTVTAAGLTGTVVGRAAERLGATVTGLAQTGARMAVLVVGLLILLSALGIAITPLLTALGVGGLAIALALQDTLANLFAGMHLLVDRPIRVGDHVKVGDGIEGAVVDVGWRSTRLRTLGNTVTVVPNSTVARSTIVNYALPDPRLLVSLRVAVDGGAEPDQVEAALVAAAREALGVVPGLLADPPPQARFAPGFGESSLEFTLNVWVASFAQQFEVQHELRKRVLRRLREAGIELAVPVRAVRVSGGPRTLPHAQ